MEPLTSSAKDLGVATSAGVNRFLASIPARRSGRRRARPVPLTPYGRMFFVALLLGMAGAVGFVAVVLSLFVGG